jgi:hypothetical protein
MHLYVCVTGDGVRLLSANRFKQLIRDSTVIEVLIDPRLFKVSACVIVYNKHMSDASAC